MTGMTYRTPAAAFTVGLLIIIVADARAGQQRAAAQPRDQHETKLPAGNVEHGRYLAEHVAMCIECHSGRDGNGNIVPSEAFDGGPLPFNPPEGWAIRVPRNRGLPGYTDEEALRVLTEGAIGRDGKQLRPPMPRFRMTPQDAADVIAFLRSLP
jgi:mono/diheme cytochrome c family protein